MNRTFSVIRRRAPIVDLVTPLVDGTQTYRLKWAANFDGSFTTFLDSTNVGFLDPAINIAVVGAQPTSGRQVRIVFNPTTYSIPDGKSFWLQLWRVPFGGSEVQVSAAGLILADTAQHGIGAVTIQGTAPNASDSTGSLQIDFPRLMQDFRVHNQDAANSLFVSMEQDGAESKVLPNAVSQFGLNSTQGSLWVRGGGGSVPFSIVCTAAFPR
jgi:hypothetical protein